MRGIVRGFQGTFGGLGVFTRCAIKKLVLISPYVQATNQLEVNYLSETGYTVLHAKGLALESQAYATVTPEEWKKIGTLAFVAVLAALLRSIAHRHEHASA